MAFTNDYIMRQIEGASALMAKLLLEKDVNPFEMFTDEGEMSAEGLLYQRLKKLVDGGAIGKAEDLLFDELRANTTPEYLKVARLFYEDLSQLDDATLERGNFSRREILDGIQDAQGIFASSQGDAVG